MHVNMHIECEYANMHTCIFTKLHLHNRQQQIAQNTRLYTPVGSYLTMISAHFWSQVEARESGQEVNVQCGPLLKGTALYKTWQSHADFEKS